MGGTTSKFAETDWTRASGKLDTSQDTLDGAAPTTKYQVLYLIKRGVNQREFDVTDEEDNLLYTTRQVPGTISCFDVLGKEMDAFLLRVNVDLARRYWTVCRYQVPTFDGQKPDKVATEKVAAERLLAFETESESASASRETFITPLLFRKACITVSWSRYMAVATMFGTPTAAQLAKYNERDDTDDEDEAFELHDAAGATKELKSLFGRASSHITERIRARTSSTSSTTADYYKPIKITGVNRPSNSLGDDDASDDNSSNHSFCRDSEGVEVSLEETEIVPCSSPQLQNNSSNNEQPDGHGKNNADTVVVKAIVSVVSDKQPEIAGAIDKKDSGHLNDNSENSNTDNGGTATDSALNKHESTESDVAASSSPSGESGVCGVTSTNNTTDDSDDVDATTAQEQGVESSTALQLNSNDPVGVESIPAINDKPEIMSAMESNDSGHLNVNGKSVSLDTDNNGTVSGSIKNESTGSEVVLSSSSLSAESGVCSVTDSDDVDATTAQEQGVESSTALQLNSNDPVGDKPEIMSAMESNDSGHVNVNGKSVSLDTDNNGTVSGSIKNESTGSEVVLSSSSLSAESGVCSVTDSGDVDATMAQDQGFGSTTSMSTDGLAIHNANDMPVCMGPPRDDPDEVPTGSDGTKTTQAITPQRDVPNRFCNSLAKSAPPQAIPKRSRPETSSGINFDTDAARTSPKTRGADVGKWILQQSRTFRDTYSRPKKPKKEDPMEGVIRLDQPLLLCQEIYTKLIGNHQTTRVSKEKVLELLQQDEAHHQQEKKEKGGNDDGENPELTQEIMDSVAELAIIDDETNDGIAEHKSNNDTAEPSTSRDSSGEAASTTDPIEVNIEQPLVGYWKWENTFRTHKMKLHLAKGSDLALHVVLAIVVNQVRYERNAVAITI